MTESSTQVRVPQQKRGIETRNRILDAAKELFSENGFHGTNSKEIAARAGVSIGSFYSYFKNKKSLFVEVFEAYESRRIMQIITSQAPPEGIDPARKRAFVEQIIQSIIDAHDQSPDFHREVLAMHYADADIAADYHQMQQQFVEQFRDYLTGIPHKLRVEDIDAAALVVCTAVEEIVHSLKMFDPPLPEKRVVSALADMVHRYLFKSDL